MTGPRLVLADDDGLARTALAELLGARAGPGIRRRVQRAGAAARRHCVGDPTSCSWPTRWTPAPDYPVCGESARSAPVLVLARRPCGGRAAPGAGGGCPRGRRRDLDLRRAGAVGQAALRGEACVPRGMLGSLLRDLIERRRRDDEALARYRRLTGRERDVLRMLARGADVNDIAPALVLSPQTVRSHLQHVLDKLEVHSRAEAVAFVLEHDLLDQPPTEGQP